MQPITAALLGMEHPHSLAHLRTLQALSEVGEILLWDESEAALGSTVAKQGAKVSATYTNLDQLLARTDLFFAIAAIRNDLVPDIFIRTLEAGKHVMAEKPIGRTAVDTERVIAAAERTGSHLVDSFFQREKFVIAHTRSQQPRCRAILTGVDHTVGLVNAVCAHHITVVLQKGMDEFIGALMKDQQHGQIFFDQPIWAIGLQAAINSSVVAQHWAI